MKRAIIDGVPRMLTVFGILAVLSGSYNAVGADELLYQDQVQGEFRTKLHQVANHLQIPVNSLIAVIALETARPTNPGRGNPTFDPAITNDTTGAVGLIQFMPRTAKDLGTTCAAL